MLDARIPIVKVNEVLDTAIKTLHHYTLEGFALARMGRLPDVGASFHEGDYEFLVTSMNERSILQLVARRIES